MRDPFPQPCANHQLLLWSLLPALPGCSPEDTHGAVRALQNCGGFSPILLEKRGEKETLLSLMKLFDILFQFFSLVSVIKKKIVTFSGHFCIFQVHSQM